LGRIKATKEGMVANSTYVEEARSNIGRDVTHGRELGKTNIPDFYIPFRLLHAAET
jgi:hypothetical protein